MQIAATNSTSPWGTYQGSGAAQQPGAATSFLDLLAAPATDEPAETSTASTSTAVAAKDLSRPPLFGVEPRNDKIYVEDIRANYHEARDQFYSRLSGIFAEHGIDTNEQIRLQTGYDGSVVVVSDHPQRQEIEQIFRDNRELRDQFVRLDTQASFLRAADEATEFQRAYWDDPVKALERFSHLFDRSSPPQYTLVMQAGEFLTEFV